MAEIESLARPYPVTPPSYHRIISQALQIPTDKAVSIPVGLLACQRDPLLRELASTVVSCTQEPIEHSGPTSNRKKKAPANGSASKGKILGVVLHDTVLFPEGGGQPSDIGILRTTEGEQHEVVEVKRHGGHAVHYVKTNSKEGEMKGLEVGASVTTALGEVGYARRLDHMCMHTSQHVLSALLETHLGLPTLSWALTTYPTPSYVELPRALTPVEIAQIQEMAHKLAYEGRAVHVEVEPLDAGNRPGVTTLESGRSVGKALPQDYTGGVKRVVVIDGVDRNPCCGTHLPTLHNLQIFLLPQTESLSRGSATTSRLYFLCGPRLHAHLASSHNWLTATAGTMSCGPSQVPERVAQVVDERKRIDKRAEELEGELAKLIAGNILQEMEKNWLDNVNGEEKSAGLYTRHYHRSDDPVNALSMLQSISSVIAHALANSSRRYIVVLTSSPNSQSNTSTSTVLLLSSEESLVKTIGDGLKSKLNVRGGGKGLRWSGKWTGVWKDSRESILVEEILGLL